MDVTDGDQWQAAIACCEEALGAPNVLVNNAGVAPMAPFEDTPDELFDTTMAVNVRGVFLGMRAVFPVMRAAGGGSIVNISSGNGFIASDQTAAYVASKFAVRALSEAMNIDLLGTKIRVSSVDPGLAETEFSEVRFDGDTDRAESVYSDTEPLTAEDVADAVMYVANAPEHVDIFNLVLMPTVQRYPGYIDRANA